MKLAKGGWVWFCFIFALIALRPASTLGITIRDDVPDSSYLSLAQSPDYASVGTFVPNGGYSGSGVLIAPDWVLLSAHEVWLATSGTFTIGGISYNSSQLYRDPAWNSNNSLAGNDFGLVHLSSSVTAIPPAMLYTGSSELGQVGTYVGYGLTGTGLTGYITSADGQERACQNVLDRTLGNPSLLIGSGFYDPATTPGALPLEGCVAPGDSGGGLFVTIDAQTYLAGIISLVASTNGTTATSVYGNVSGAGLVSAAMPWIASVVPEPSTSSLLLGAGLVALARRQIRRKP